MCKQLGFSDASQATIESFFGQVEASFSYDNVACNGNEETLDDCYHDDDHNCSGVEAAGVICTIWFILVSTKLPIQTKMHSCRTP